MCFFSHLVAKSAFLLTIEKVDRACMGGDAFVPFRLHQLSLTEGKVVTAAAAGAVILCCLCIPSWPDWLAPAQFWRVCSCDTQDISSDTHTHTTTITFSQVLSKTIDFCFFLSFKLLARFKPSDVVLVVWGAVNEYVLCYEGIINHVCCFCLYH